MRLAVFSDIHGNYEALQAFIVDAQQRHVHRYMCLGDIVGYGASPNQCIELIKSLSKMNCVLGNHDAAAIWRYSPYAMTKDAKEVILWTIDRLTEDNKVFLKQLRPMLIMGGMCFVHANPYNPEAYRYVINRKYAIRSFASVRQKMTFIGHSHKPLIITRKNFFQIGFETPKGTVTHPVAKIKKQIINCGSIGQPRDGDQRGCYCIFDSLANRLEFIRVDYDYQAAASKISLAGLPDFLANRLARGR